MKQVDDFYSIYEQSQAGLNLTRRRRPSRRVYVASDDPGLFRQCVVNYPDYQFFFDRSYVRDANQPSERRNTNRALIGFLLDVYYLSRSQFLVCTFSSNVCRLVYELMQAGRSSPTADMSNRFKSLDIPYMFFPYSDRLLKIAILDNQPVETDRNEKRELTFLANEILTPSIENLRGTNYDGDSFTGYMLGFNSKNQEGLIPLYKVREYFP